MGRSISSSIFGVRASVLSGIILPFRRRSGGRIGFR